MTTIASPLAYRTLHFAEIHPEQIEDALGPLDAAARWLAECGIEQWPVSFTESPDRRRKIEGEAERGNVFVWYSLGQPVATATITDWQDPDFASGWTDQARAQYVMRFAVSPTGRTILPGLGTTILEYATYLAEYRGSSVLRLDCNKRNEKLHRYYYERGFNHVGTVDVPGRKSGALWEKRVK
jgi:hypothetical protein